MPRRGGKTKTLSRTAHSRDHIARGETTKRSNRREENPNPEYRASDRVTLHDFEFPSPSSDTHTPRLVQTIPRVYAHYSKPPLMRGAPENFRHKEGQEVGSYGSRSPATPDKVNSRFLFFFFFFFFFFLFFPLLPRAAVPLIVQGKSFRSPATDLGLLAR